MTPDKRFFLSVAGMLFATLMIVAGAMWFEETTSQFDEACHAAGGRVVVVDYGVSSEGEKYSGEIEECVKDGIIITDTLDLALIEKD